VCPSSALGHVEAIAGARQTVSHLKPIHERHKSFSTLSRGVAIGDATNFISKSEADIVPPTIRAEALQGEALTFRNTVSRPDHLNGAGPYS